MATKARLIAGLLAVVGVLCGTATSAAAAPRAIPHADPALTLTPGAGGTTLYAGVGTALVTAAPYVASGGSGQVSWSYDGLPRGLSGSPTSGVIGGTPSLSGSYPVTLTVSDGDGQMQTGTFTYLVSAIGLSTRSGLLSYVVAISNDAVSSAPVIATGDTQGLTWSATGLPPGLQIDPQSGTVNGTPTTVGGYTTRFAATNVVGETAYLPVLFEVVVGYTCNYREHAHVGAPVSINCGVFWSSKPNGGGRWLALPGHLSYSAKKLPAGLRISAATGVVSGTPRKSGTAVFTITVRSTPDGILVTSPTHWTSVVRCVIGG